MRTFSVTFRYLHTGAFIIYALMQDPKTSYTTQSELEVDRSLPISDLLKSLDLTTKSTTEELILAFRSLQVKPPEEPLV